MSIVRNYNRKFPKKHITFTFKYGVNWYNKVKYLIVQSSVAMLEEAEPFLIDLAKKLQREDDP
ncbi:hypothetical protein BAZO_10221 [Schinkia azotoformans LMG 9581]|uniref:Uncharacterized protein n=1 Tax=Schinkia azotoformans LMG 9581 TaxID=1131731 RepID=K6DFT0_SCHAZ|nr:hypothetical protein BAZO_10221 [Schinkia azotoformans LMG 9581]